MSNLIEEDVSTFSIANEVDQLILKGEVSLIEELRNAFEAGLNIDVIEKPSGKVCFSCTNGKQCSSCKCLKEQEHKGGSRSFKSITIISHDECSQVELGKSTLDSGELKLCKALINCASFPCSVDSSVSSHNVSNDDSRKAKSEILNGKQQHELKKYTLWPNIFSFFFSPITVNIETGSRAKWFQTSSKAIKEMGIGCIRATTKFYLPYYQKILGSTIQKGRIRNISTEKNQVLHVKEVKVPRGIIRSEFI